MPVKIVKIPNTKKYKVVDPSGKVHAKNTTKTKAVAQARIINCLTKKKRRKPRKKS